MSPCIFNMWIKKTFVMAIAIKMNELVIPTQIWFVIAIRFSPVSERPVTSYTTCGCTTRDTQPGPEPSHAMV